VLPRRPSKLAGGGDRIILQLIGPTEWSDDPASLTTLAADLKTVWTSTSTEALTLQSMGEVLALLRKGGVDARAAFEVLTGSLFDGKVHKTYGGKIVESHYSPPGMTTPLAVKDLRLALTEAEHSAWEARPKFLHPLH
jgi:hypothetical protein